MSMGLEQTIMATGIITGKTTSWEALSATLASMTGITSTMLLHCWQTNTKSSCSKGAEVSPHQGGEGHTPGFDDEVAPSPFLTV